jgi:hypothetical protein
MFSYFLIEFGPKMRPSPTNTLSIFHAEPNSGPVDALSIFCMEPNSGPVASSSLSRAHHLRGGVTKPERSSLIKKSTES